MNGGKTRKRKNNNRGDEKADQVIKAIITNILTFLLSPSDIFHVILSVQA